MKYRINWADRKGNPGCGIEHWDREMLERVKEQLESDDEVNGEEFAGYTYWIEEIEEPQP